jgi:hypothetical protein
MKPYILIILLFGQTLLFAQTKSENIAFTYGEFKAGYATSQFGANLKDQINAGNFSNSGGGLFTLGAYHKFKNINHLNFGGKFSALGASPAKGDNGQEMFFNWWGQQFQLNIIH